MSQTRAETRVVRAGKTVSGVSLLVALLAIGCGGSTQTASGTGGGPPGAGGGGPGAGGTSSQATGGAGGGVQAAGGAVSSTGGSAVSGGGGEVQAAGGAVSPRGGSTTGGGGTGGGGTGGGGTAGGGTAGTVPATGGTSSAQGGSGTGGTSTAGSPGSGGGTGRGGASGGTGGGGTGAGGSVPTGPYPSQACLTRASTLLGQMTNNEKYAQMLQMERAGTSFAQVRTFGLGSVFSEGGSAPNPNTATGWANMTDEYHAAALASRLKIPMIYGADEIHGMNTVPGAVVFPHNIGLGATRNVALVEQCARITAREARGCGVDQFFSPVVAVARDERWGRTYESFGETTELASTMGVAMVKGIQFTETGAPSRVLANAKHYVGDGGVAGGDTGGNTSGNEATLRAIHLEPYRAAVNAGLGSIMASYSSWQGTPMHTNRTMLTDVLKGSGAGALGFAGFMLSDFNGCGGNPVNCVNAGMDMLMTDVASVSDGNITNKFNQLSAVPQARIDDAVRRILAIKCAMGLFEHNGRADRTLTPQVGSAAHRQVARKAVQESLVVLKNDGNTLPLSKTATIALAGKSAASVINQCGGWTIGWQSAPASTGVPGATSIRQAMEAAAGGSRVLYSAGGTSTSGASVGVAVIGETPYAEGAGDKGNLVLDSADVNVVRALKNAGLKTVVVLIIGRPYILDSILSSADAIVVAWLPGSEGAGVTDILFGDAKPTGKLPHSWPRSMSQVPINYGDANYDPLYPYGHGLTY